MTVVLCVITVHGNLVMRSDASWVDDGLILERISYFYLILLLIIILVTIIMNWFVLWEQIFYINREVALIARKLYAAFKPRNFPIIKFLFINAPPSFQRRSVSVPWVHTSRDIGKDQLSHKFWIAYKKTILNRMRRVIEILYRRFLSYFSVAHRMESNSTSGMNKLDE